MTDLLVGTDDGLHRVRPSGDPMGVELSGQPVVAIAREAGGWWAIVDGDSVWRGTAPGNWDLVGSVENARANCLSWTTAGLFVGTSDAGLLRLAGETLEGVSSFDEVDGRSKWYTPWGGPPDSRSLSQGSDGAIHVNVHVGGIVRSRDDGGTWEPTIDIDSDVHQVLAPEGMAGLVLAATALGLAVSEDGGDSWRFDTGGLHGSYCRAVAFAGDMVFVTASESHRGNRAGVYRRPISGGDFEKCSDGLPEWFSPNIDSHCLAASGELVAFGTEAGGVFLSEDRGTTWREIVSGLPAARCLALD